MSAPMRVKSGRRVVVTGIGIVSCLGSKVNEVFCNLINGKIGISSLEGTEYEKLPCRVAGVIPESEWSIDEEYNKSERREKSRPIILALASARRALLDSHLNNNQASLDMLRCGVSVGMGMPDLQEIYETGKSLADKGARAVSPFFIPRNLVNMASGHISMETGFQGPNLSVSTACATGLHCIGEGFRLIERGDADLMLCGGSEAPVCPLSLTGFSRMRALCTDSNDDPQKASRPFDSSRSGFVMSEGAATVILEDLEHALARGSRIYAEVLGYGLCGDAHHISAPREDGDGAYRCMKLALHDACRKASDVSYINAHATSTPLGDKAESQAIHRLFGDNDQPVSVSSVKGAFGHLLGAAGSLEAAITALSCYKGVIPPTVNLKNPDVPGNFSHVVDTNHIWDTEKRVAVTNSFGFGGTNASLCIGNYSGE